MNEPENFLERWSKRKLARAEADHAVADENSPGTSEGSDASAPVAAKTDAAAAETHGEIFDPASLPPIDSIGADTDIKAFLRPGVPPELTRAALRRAWSADPAIRDFVGLVENGWDFNDPQAMAGFGPIDPTEVARLAGQIIGGLVGKSISGEQNAVDGDDFDAMPSQASGRTDEQTAAEGDESLGEDDAPHKNSRG